MAPMIPDDHRPAGWRRTATLLALAAGLAGSFLSGPARAQEDAMDLQRCILRCLDSAQNQADQSYLSCVEQVCTAGGAPAAAPGQKTDAAGAVWAYGTDPVLGLSAHVRTAQGALGFTCGRTGFEITLMVENSLFGGDDATLMFDNTSVSTGIRRDPGQISTETNAACFVGLDAFRAGSTVFVTSGKTSAIQMEGDVAVHTIDQAGRSVTIRRGVETVDLLGALPVPLKASSRAISALLEGCPGVVADIANNCGI
jgi:hypothetical protein